MSDERAPMTWQEKVGLSVILALCLGTLAFCAPPEGPPLPNQPASEAGTP